jgi:protein-disulfide isomerase/rhodanese-related sulfurtransferase
MRKSLTLALSLLGLFDSLYLLYTYTSPSRPMVCIGTGCDAVRASAYSTLWGVPMPLFGVLGYMLLAGVIVAESVFPARLAKWARHALLGMTGFGFLLSVYLEYVQAFVIHAYCAWCVTSGVVMTALFALAVINVRRSGPEPDPAAQLAGVRKLFAVGAAGLLAGIPAFYLLTRQGEIAPAVPLAAPASLAELLVRPRSHETGNPNAPLTVVEFGDFECPVCARAETAAREVRARYAGQVRFVFRQFPLERIHPLAAKAAEASECAGEQGRFWEMVEKIYSRQNGLEIEDLKRDAAELGLDQPRFSRCLASGVMAGSVRQDAEDGRALGVRATPTFFIGQRMIEGVLTAAQLSELIAGQLANKGPEAAPARKMPAAAPDAATSPAKESAAAPHTLPAPANPGQASAAFPAAAPAGFIPGLQAAAPGGFFGSPQTTGAACSEADAAKKQPTLIDTKELRLLLSSDAKTTLVDVRPAAEYAAGRIPGSVSLPADEVGRRWSTLPKDRTIVFYEGGRSSGDICAAGRAAGRTLLEHGFPFSQVKVYQDGLAGWERSDAGVNK